MGLALYEAPQPARRKASCECAQLISSRPVTKHIRIEQDAARPKIRPSGPVSDSGFPSYSAVIPQSFRRLLAVFAISAACRPSPLRPINTSQAGLFTRPDRQFLLVEPRGIEPLTSWLPAKRSPS